MVYLRRLPLSTTFLVLLYIPWGTTPIIVSRATHISAPAAFAEFQTPLKNDGSQPAKPDNLPIPDTRLQHDLSTFQQIKRASSDDEELEDAESSEPADFGEQFAKCEKRGRENQETREYLEQKPADRLPKTPLPKYGSGDGDFSLEDLTSSGQNLVKYPTDAKDLLKASESDHVSDEELMENEIFASYKWKSSQDPSDEISTLVCLPRKHMIIKTGADPSYTDETLAGRIFASLLKAAKDTRSMMVDLQVPLTETIVFPDVIDQETNGAISGILEKLETDNIVLKNPWMYENPSEIVERIWYGLMGTPILSAIEKMILEWKYVFVDREVVKIDIFRSKAAAGTERLLLVAGIGDISSEAKKRITQQREQAMSENDADNDDDVMDMDDYDGSPNVDDSDDPMDIDTGEDTHVDTDASSQQSSVSVEFHCGSLIPIVPGVFEITEADDGNIMENPAVGELEGTTWASEQALKGPIQPSYRTWNVRYRLNPSAREADPPRWASFKIASSGIQNHLVVMEVSPRKRQTQATKLDRVIPVEDIIITTWCRSEGSEALFDITFMQASSEMLKWIKDFKNTADPPISKEEILTITYDSPTEAENDSDGTYKALGRTPEGRAVKGILQKYEIDPRMYPASLEIPDHGASTPQTTMIFRLSREVKTTRAWMAAVRRGCRLATEKDTVVLYDYRIPISPSDNPDQDSFISKLKFQDSESEDSSSSLLPAHDLLQDAQNRQVDVFGHKVFLAPQGSSPADIAHRYTQVKVSSPEGDVLDAALSRLFYHLSVQNIGLHGGNSISRSLLGRLLAETWIKIIGLQGPEEISKLRKSRGEYGIRFISILNLKRSTKQILDIAFELAQLDKTDVLAINSISSSIWFALDKGETSADRMKRLQVAHVTPISNESVRRQIWHAILGTYEVSAIERFHVLNPDLLFGRVVNTIFVRWKLAEGSQNREPEIILALADAYSPKDRREADGVADTTKILKENSEIGVDVIRGGSVFLESLIAYGIRAGDLHLPSETYVTTVANMPEDQDLPDAQVWPWPSYTKHGPWKLLENSEFRSKQLFHNARDKDQGKNLYQVVDVKVNPLREQNDLAETSSKELKATVALSKSKFTRHIILIAAPTFEPMPSEQHRKELSKILFAVWKTHGSSSQEASLTASRDAKHLMLFVFPNLAKQTVNIINSIWKISGWDSSKRSLIIQMDMKIKRNIMFRIRHDWKIRLLLSTIEIGAVHQLLLDYPNHMGSQRIKSIYVEKQKPGNSEFSLVVETEIIE